MITTAVLNILKKISGKKCNEETASMLVQEIKNLTPEQKDEFLIFLILGTVDGNDVWKDLSIK